MKFGLIAIIAVLAAGGAEAIQLDNGHKHQHKH